MREGGTIECAFPEELVHLIVMNGFDDVEMDVISFPAASEAQQQFPRN